MKKRNRKSGQTMVEYIIIVVIIAIAAIAIFGAFGDTIRSKLGGAVKELDPNDLASSGVDAALAKDSDVILKEDIGEQVGN